MDERILVKSRKYLPKGLLAGLIILSLLIALVSSIMLLTDLVSAIREVSDFKITAYRHRLQETCGPEFGGWDNDEDADICAACEKYVDYYESYYSIDEYENFVLDVKYLGQQYESYLKDLAPAFYVILFWIVVFLWVRNHSLTVTDKRIYGTGAFGTKVSIPMDRVSGVSTLKLLGGISIASASSKTRFLLVSDVDEIYEAINDQLILRQNKS